MSAEVANTIALGVPAEDYHRKELGVASAGVLHRLDEKTPAHYRAWVDGQDEIDTPAMQFGRAYHARVLEPAVFAQQFIVSPDFGDLRSSTNRKARDEWREAHPGVSIITQSDADLIEAMHAGLMANPKVAELLAEGDSEVTMRWTDPATGLRCKARADRWNRQRRYMVDLKTTLDASPRQFARSVVSYGYDVTHAHYTEGARECGEPIDHYYIVAQEKRAPHLAAVYQLSPAAEARGYEIRSRGMATIAGCLAANQWPGYPSEVQDLELPGWAITEEMEIGYVE